ncbi:MAG: MFS transporter [Acidobacteriota bacterium]
MRSSNSFSGPGRLLRDADTPIILATGTAHLLNHAYLLLYPQFLLLLQQEFGIGLFALGQIANLHYLAAGVGALPAGWLAHRIGPVATIRTFLFGSSAALILVASVQGTLSLVLALATLGAFCSLYHPSGLALLSLRSRRMGRALGLHGAIGNFGIAFTPLVAAGVAQVAGWRACCLLFAIPGVVVGWKWPALPEGNRSASPEPASENDPLPASRGAAQQNGPDSIHWRPLLFLYVAVALTGFVYKGFTTFLTVRFASGDGPGALGAAGAMATFVLLVGVIGQYAGGNLSQRLPPVPLFITLIALSTPFLALIGTGRHWAAGAAAGFALFHFAAQPVSNGYLARCVPARYRSLGYGLYFTLSFGVGSFATSAAGYLAEHQGIEAVFPFLAIVSAASVVAIAASASRKLKRPPAPA